MDSNKVVRKRRVFYIPGYDPNPPRRYRELYRKEGGEQARISGYRIALKARPHNVSDSKGYGWFVRAQIDGAKVQTEYDVLQWSDLVQESMKSGILATYTQLIRTSWLYISTGTLRRLTWLRKGPVIAGLYPVLMLLGQLFVAILAARLVGGVVARFTFAGAGWVVGLPLMIYILRWFRSKDRKLFAYYLMHDYAFTASLSGKNPTVLEDRLQLFRQQIVAALNSDVDEVLVVGHSSGAHLAINILADIWRDGAIVDDGPVLAFLSVGQVVPMVSFLPNAQDLRRDLRDLSLAADICWVDISAPGDGCSFALCDPVAVTGVAPEGKLWPLVISAAFTQTLSPARWTSLKRRFFRLHFQYLCAFDRPGDYDYFQITAGPVLLADRYAGRAASKSRIDVPVSGNRSLTP